MSSLSQGPFNHNRFAAIDEHYAREKMYFMEKAKEKKLDPVGEEDADVNNDKVVDGKDKYLKNRREAIGNAMGKGKDKKEMKESSCSSGCDCDDCKKSKKKKMAENREMAYGGGKAGNMSGDGSSPKGPRNPKNKTQTMMGKDGKPLFKEGMAMDEAIVSYLMYHGYANNPVSAEIVLKHMSETWLNDVANEIHEGYKPMSKSATASSERRSSDLYNKETSSAKAGDEKKTNKAMQDRIKVDGARNRYGSR